jgi:hypothetical protein
VGYIPESSGYKFAPRFALEFASKTGCEKRHVVLNRCCERAESTRHHMTRVTKRITNALDISSIPRYVEDVSALMCSVLHCFEALIAKVIPKHM